MAGYRVDLRPAAAKALRKLPADTQHGVLGILENLQAMPRPNGAVNLAGKRPYLRLRLGDYRIIYAVDDKSKAVTVALIGHRQDVYRSLSRLFPDL